MFVLAQAQLMVLTVKEMLFVTEHKLHILQVGGLMKTASQYRLASWQLRVNNPSTIRQQSVNNASTIVDGLLRLDNNC